MNKKIIFSILILVIIGFGGFLSYNIYDSYQIRRREREGIIQFVNSNFILENYIKESNSRIKKLDEILQTDALYSESKTKVDFATTFGEVLESNQKGFNQDNTVHNKIIDEIITTNTNEITAIKYTLSKVPTLQCFFDSQRQTKEFVGGIEYMTRNPGSFSTGIVYSEEVPIMQTRLLDSYKPFQNCSLDNQKEYNEFINYLESIVTEYAAMPIAQDFPGQLNTSRFDNIYKLKENIDIAKNKYFYSFGFDTNHRSYTANIKDINISNKVKINSLHADLVSQYGLEKDFGTGKYK